MSNKKKTKIITSDEITDAILLEDRTDITRLEKTVEESYGETETVDPTTLNFTGFGVDEQNVSPTGKVWTKEELINYHNKVIADSNRITLEDEKVACFTYCINTSGGDLMLPDIEAKLLNPESEQVITFSPGERFNLQSYFTKKAINRNRRHLIGAMKMKSQLFGLPTLLCVESPDVNLPFPVVQKSTMEKMKSKGLKIVEMPENEYDIKLRDEIKKEEEYNARLTRRPGDGEKQMTQEEFEAQFA